MALGSILTKSKLPGSIGTPSTPPTPGTPPTPAYDLQVPTTVYETQYIYHGVWVDPATSQTTDDNTGAGQVFIGYVEVVYVPVTTIETVHVPADPGTPPAPGSPGTSDTPARLLTGWNGGAITIQSWALEADGSFYINFYFPKQPVGVVVGLAQVDANGNPSLVRWGFDVQADTFKIKYNGYDDPTPHAMPSSGTLSISGVRLPPGEEENELTEIIFFGDAYDPSYENIIAATSFTDNDGVEVLTKLYCNACLYMSGDAVGVDDPPFTAVYTSTEIDGSSDGVLGGLSGFALDDAADIGGYAESHLPTLRSIASGVISTLSDTSGVLAGVDGYAFDSTFHEDCQGKLRGMSGYVEAGLTIPAYAVAVCALRPLWGFALCDGANYGSCAGVLDSDLEGFSLDSAADPGGYVRGRLTQLRSNIFTIDLLNYAFMQLIGGGSGHVYGLFGIGYQDTNVRYGFFGELSGYNFAGLGGARASETLSGYHLGASGTTTTLGEIVMSLSGYGLMASATGTTMGRGAMKLSGYDVNAFGGAQAEMALSGYLMLATGLRGIIGEAILQYRPLQFQVNASGHIGAFGSVIGILESLQLANQARGNLRAGHYTLEAHGEAFETADTEGYSHTMLDDGSIAVTRYTQLPFDYMMRFGDRYVGIGPLGIYEFTGNQFDSDGIVSAIETGIADFGAPELKRTRHLYLNGRLNGNFTIEAMESGRTVDDFDVSFAQPLGNVRVTLGRGMHARYLSFIIQSNGQDFEIHEMGPEIDVLRRTA